MLIRFTSLLAAFRQAPFDTSTPEGRAQERHRRVALTAAFSAVSKGTAILTGLVVVPLTISYLGVERYGLWMTVSSLITMFAFADLGIGNGLVSEVARAHGVGDTRRAAEAVSSAFFVLALVAVVGTPVFALLYFQIDWPAVFNVHSTLAMQEAGPALAVFVWCFLVSVPLGIVQRVQMGCQEGYVSGLWATVGQVASLLAVIAVIRSQGGLPSLVLAMSGVPVLVTAASALLLFGRQHPDLRPRWSLVSSSTAGRIIRTGWWFFLIQLIVTFQYSADSLIIAQLLGQEEVSRYAVAMKLAVAGPTIVAMWLMPLWPAVSEAAARNDWSWIRRTFSRTFLGSAGVVAIGAVGLVLFGDWIILKWVGPGIVLGTAVLTGFGLFMLASAMSGPVAMFMNGLGIIKAQVVTAILMTLVSLWARIHFAPIYGITGVIVSNAVAQILLVSLPSWWILWRVMSRSEAGTSR